MTDSLIGHCRSYPAGIRDVRRVPGTGLPVPLENQAKSAEMEEGYKKQEPDVPAHPSAYDRLENQTSKSGCKIMGDTGLEPVTSTMSTWRSSQLS
jgi:hypothetical protein